MIPFAALVLWQNAQQSGFSLAPRFESAAPLYAPPITVDSQITGKGLANQLARDTGRQGRVLWIDATANIERYDTEAKLAELVGKVARAGFNTIVLDIKPISGQVIYRSNIAPRLLEWKGKRLDPDVDVLRTVLRHAKPAGLSVLVSLNAFSEGHRLFRVGPGYQQRELQTVIYDYRGQVRTASGAIHSLSLVKDKVDPNAITVFSSADKLPAPSSGAFAVTLRATGEVQDGFAFGGLPPRAPTVPRGGVILYGQGEAAEYLRHNVQPGKRVAIETKPNFVPMADWTGTQIPLMMNPNHAEVRRHSLAILEEVVRRYPVDGVLYDDRLRYAGINADFSETTRLAFEKFLGKSVVWPDDALRFTLTPDLRRGMRPGRYYDQWMAWRALVLKRYVVDARRLVKRIRPGAVFGAYVGSWYGEYPALGHNYASADLETPFWFLSPNYQRTGTASLFDLLIPGCYYTTATVHEALEKGGEIGATVEASAAMANRLVADRSWTYAGLSLADFRENPTGLMNALQAACAASQGVMVFDLSHDIEPMWPVFGGAFSQRLKPPHSIPELLDYLHAVRKTRKQAPVRLTTGASGTGQ